MKVPLLDTKAQIAPIRGQINKAISKVVSSGGFILGQEVMELEKEITKYCNAGYAIGVSNGTDAIALSLKALGIGQGDSVICPAFTYYATAGAIASIGARPIFADIDPKTYNISIDSIKQILRCTKYDVRSTIKAIIPVHLYGQCANMYEIMKIAKKHRLKVVEDTAQAFGAIYNGKKAGTIGDCGTVSFYPAKNLGAFGDAGCILTNNLRLTKKLRLLSNQGASAKNKYEHIHMGYNARLDTIQAAVLKIKLKYMDAWNKKRMKNAAYYNKKLKHTGLVTPYVLEENSHIYHQYVLKVKRGKEKIRKYLISKGIDSRTYYPIPLHLQPCFKYLGYKNGDFPESEKCAQQTFTIPIYPELTKKQMDYVVSKIKEIV